MPRRPAAALPAWSLYALAALAGLGTAAATFPAGFLFPAAPFAAAPMGDAAQHAITQMYFVAEPWGWPLLLAHGLDAPQGTHIAMADGIPLLALALKAIGAWLPAGFHGIGLWYALATILQPLAAMWALRGAGERRALPGLGVALAALAAPAWLARYGHAALTGHFVLLAALGFYLRLAGGARLWPLAAAFALAALLVHPYLAAMALAVLAAAPLSLLLRGDGRWPRALGGLAACALLVGGAMAGLGYLGATGDGGFGLYAMNLLSPVWPARSALLGGLAGAEIDATGKGGWEGYNWLGAGLLAGLALGAVLRPGAAAGMLRRHAGLALGLLGLSAIAVTHRVGLGGAILLDLGAVPGLLEQFRASGRFFWPVAYALLLAAAVLLARLGRPGPWLVLAMGLVQVADSLPIRHDLAAWARTTQPWTLPADALRGQMAAARRLTLLPSWPCIPAGAGTTFMQAHEALALAAERALPVNTMHLARWSAPPLCLDAAMAATPFGPGELRLVLAGFEELAAAMAARAAAEGIACRDLGGGGAACLSPPGPAGRSAGGAPPGTAALPSSR